MRSTCSLVSLSARVRRCFAIMLFLASVVSSSAQKIMGSQGLMNIPTADMYPRKTFVGGGNFIATGLTNYDFPVYNYFIDFTPFSFVELTFRSTLLRMKEERPYKHYCEQDRSFTIRIRPIAEDPDKWYPGVMIGSNDFFSYMGHSYFSAVYGALTKHITICDVVKVGSTLGYSKKIAKGVVYDGVFAGMEFVPMSYQNVRAMVEYDTKGFNVGAEVNFFKHLNALLYTREFKQICGGISYQYTIKY